MIEHLTIGFLTGILTMMPCFPDPFHKKTEKVTLWEWLYREAYEFINGEVKK